MTKAQTASEILDKADNVITTSDDITQNVEITLIDKNKNQQTRTAVLMQKGEDKRLFEFTSPSSYEGVSFLSLPDDVMYLYMPSYGKERRIASSVKNQKFAGTDMSYDDMAAKSYNDNYTPTIKSSDATSWVLELIPKTAGEYSKVLLTIRKIDYIPLKAEFFDKANNKIKVSEFEFAKQGNFWYVKTLTVKDLKTNHTTIMKSSDVKFNQGLSDDIFTVRNLTM